MSSDRPIYLWVDGFEEGPRGVLLEGVEFDERYSWEYGESPAWYAICDGERRRLEGDEVRRVHLFIGGYRWRAESLRNLPAPPYLLTDDADLRPAFDGAVGLRPTEQTRAYLIGIVEAEGRFDTPVSGPGWLGMLTVTRDGPEGDHGHLLAFSRTGAIPDEACENVIMPDIEETFGAIDLLKRGPV